MLPIRPERATSLSPVVHVARIPGTVCPDPEVPCCPCHVRRPLSLPPYSRLSQAPDPPWPPRHTFAAKYPAKRAADIRPGEAWPATAVGWNEAGSKLQLRVVHHESNTPVEAFHPDDNMLGALCLF